MTFQLTPYETPFYFIYLAIALAPIVVGLIIGKRFIWYQTFVTLLFLYVTFGGKNYQQGLALIAYVIFQTCLIGLYFKYRQKKNNTWVFVGAVALSILPLVIDKLMPVFANQPHSLLYFLGISYLTFKSVQMIMEMRDGILTEYHPIRFIQFLVFFPTISSGPIDRYRRFETDLLNPPDRDKYFKLLDKGIWFIFLGFLYNFILSYLLGSLLLPKVQDFAIGGGQISLLGTLAYMYVYSFNLFFNFAGYSLFAIGTSYIMGYETPINFNKPFLSKNIKDFWNRWHMSLSFWFRDYVFMRVVYLLTKKKIFKSRNTRSAVGYFALFLLMGFWHDVKWFYIVYGIYHAVIMIINDAWLRYKKKHRKSLPSNIWTKCLAIFITFHVICFGFLIFSGFFDVVIKMLLLN